MKKYIAIFLVLVFIIPVNIFAQGFALPQDVTITAAEAYIINLDTGLVVYEKDADTPRSIASLTKLMTALLLIEQVPDLANTPITAHRLLFTGDIIKPGTSTADIQPGETFSALDMLYGMMLPSGNEAAEAIGYYLSRGNMQNFYAMMNTRAKQLGATNTNFASAHGLVDQEGGNYSTAHDLALIAQECWKHDIFRTVVGTKMHWMPFTEHSRHNKALYPKQNPNASYYIQNTNLMLSPSSKVYRPYIKGMKTGSTHAAGRNFVSAAINERGESFIGVVLGAPWEPAEDGYAYSFHDTAALYDWIFANFSVRPTLDMTQTITETKVAWSSQTDRLRLIPENDFKTILPNDAQDTLKTEFHVPEVVYAPIEQGQKIGSVTLLLNGAEIGTVPLLAQENITRNHFLYFVSQFFNFLNSTYLKVVVILIAVFICGYISFTIWLHKKRKRRQHSPNTPTQKRKK